MKKITIQAKLSLNKESLAKLTNEQANMINGGDLTNGWWRESSPWRCGHPNISKFSCTGIGSGQVGNDECSFNATKCI